MQKLKSKVFEKFQIENKMQNVKALPRNPAFQTGVAALISVGLLSWIHIRPLGLIFLVIFGFWFYKNRCNLRIQIPPELEKHLQLVQQRIIEFRQTKPTMFCAIASGCLAALAVVGHLVSGSMVVLTGLIVAAIISTKYNFKIIKIEPKDLDFAWSEKLQQQDYELDDEFMPEVNESNLFVLERASDLASLTLPTEDGENDEDKSDEIPSELLIPDSIPEIDENSTDDEQDDLLPVVQVSKSETHIKNSLPASDASVKYSQSEDTIEFKKGHFKRDSSLSTTSSSSEESLSKGLQFPDHTAVDGPSKSRTSTSTVVARPGAAGQLEANDLVAMAVKSQTQAFLANSSKLIPTLMSGLVQGVLGVGAGGLSTQNAPIHDSTHRRLVTALDSSDESDFEILEEEDCQ
ncbi:uncharacterized protein LOC111679964 [Lucilia cuprina]|uniref:uncharacterized protein LOC111679964 n=1 Tax=Lucilia cuprina TaxID=7375 RepID=UPI001F0619D7|nr:uncharacterized protein LOC111679964 [Lucilia cuprina]